MTLWIVAALPWLVAAYFFAKVGKIATALGCVLVAAMCFANYAP